MRGFHCGQASAQYLTSRITGMLHRGMVLLASDTALTEECWRPALVLIQPRHLIDPDVTASVAGLCHRSSGRRRKSLGEGTSGPRDGADRDRIVAKCAGNGHTPSVRPRFDQCVADGRIGRRVRIRHARLWPLRAKPHNRTAWRASTDAVSAGIPDPQRGRAARLPRRLCRG